MIIYNLMYVGFYRFARLIKSNIPGSIFYNTPLDAIILMSALELINVISIWLHFKLKPVLGNYNLDMLLTGFVLLGTNYFIFLKGKRYQKIVSKVEAENDVSCTVGVIVYTALTLCVFYYSLR